MKAFAMAVWLLGWPALVQLGEWHERKYNPGKTSDPDVGGVIIIVWIIGAALIGCCEC